MARKIVLITGVTLGLGRAMVDEFVRLGHTVCGCGRSDSVIQLDGSASGYLSPAEWAQSAVLFLLKLGRDVNGQH